MGTESLPIHAWFESPGATYLIDGVGPATQTLMLLVQNVYLAMVVYPRCRCRTTMQS